MEYSVLGALHPRASSHEMSYVRFDKRIPGTWVRVLLSVRAELAVRAANEEVRRLGWSL